MFLLTFSVSILFFLFYVTGPEKNKNADNNTLDPPPVRPKSKLVRNFSALQKVTENTDPKVIKKQSLDDPAESGNPNEVSNDQSEFK